MSKIKLQKGDKVILLSGKDRGKIGVISRVIIKTNSLIVSKVNIVKKHIKATKKNPAGGVIETERPVPVSKVKLICPSCNKATRVGFGVIGKEKKRVCKKCQKAIEVVGPEDKEKK